MSEEQVLSSSTSEEINEEISLATQKCVSEYVTTNHLNEIETSKNRNDAYEEKVNECGGNTSTIEHIFSENNGTSEVVRNDYIVVDGIMVDEESAGNPMVITHLPIVNDQSKDCSVDGDKSAKEAEYNQNSAERLGLPKNVREFMDNTGTIQELLSGSDTPKAIEKVDDAITQQKNQQYTSKLTKTISPANIQEEREKLEGLSVGNILEVQTNVEKEDTACFKEEVEQHKNVGKNDTLNNSNCIYEGKSKIKVGLFTSIPQKQKSVEVLETKDYIPFSKSPLLKKQEKDERIMVRISATEEINGIIETAERVCAKYGKQISCEGNNCDSILGKETVGFCLAKNEMGNELTTSKDTHTKKLTNGNSDDTTRIESQPNKGDDLSNREVTRLNMEQTTNDNNKENNEVKLNNKIISQHPGTTGNELITSEDRELIRELVAIAVGERSPQRPTGLDKKGQMIQTFEKEYYYKLNKKPHQCERQRNGNETSTTGCKGNENISKSHFIKYAGESRAMLSNIIDTTKTDDRPDVIPRGLQYRENCFTPAVQQEKKRVNTCRKIWEFEGFQFRCDGEGEESPRSDDEIWLKVRSERQSNLSPKDVPMNEKNGNFFVDRKLVPVDLYQDGLVDQHWNPTSVLNEICAKSGWTLPTFTIVNTTDEGYLVSVNVNGQEFFPRLRGETRRVARHLASAHFLKCIGFKCDFEPSQYSTGIINDRPTSRRRSASSESNKPQEDGEDRWSRHRSVSWEDLDRDGRKINEDNSMRPRRAGEHQPRKYPPTPYPREKDQKTSKRKALLQTPRSSSNSRPQTWDKLDEIPPFVPRQPVATYGHSRALLPTPRSPRIPYFCRCKLSFPHPSVHPWRYDMNSPSMNRRPIRSLRREF